MPKPTEEQIIKILKSAAEKYSYQSKGKFEIDEFVNEVWVHGSVFELSDIRLVWGRACYDIIDYIRKCNKVKNKEIKAKIGILAEATTENKPPYINKIEEDDEMNFCLTGLDRDLKLMAILTSEGFTQREIAKTIGITQERVWYMFNTYLRPWFKYRLKLSKSG